MSSSFEKSVKGATKIKVSQSVSQGIGNRKGGEGRKKKKEKDESKKTTPKTQEAQETRERVMRDMQQILI